MLPYIFKRIASGIFAFFLFTIILFFGSNLLVPGDFVSTLSLQIQGDEARDALREELGLDEPLWRQYGRWASGLLRGDLGQSFAFFGEGGPVSGLILASLPPTLLVFVVGAVIALGIGQWLGKVTGWRTSRWVSNPLIVGSIASYTLFPPLLAFILVYFFIVNRPAFMSWKLAKANLARPIWVVAEVTPGQVMVRMTVTILLVLLAAGVVVYLMRRFKLVQLPAGLTHLLFLFALAIYWSRSADAALIQDIGQTAFVPFVAFVLLSFGDTTLIMRTSMVDTRHETYIQTARAKGMREIEVRDRHAARNALLPMLSRFVINLPYLLTGLVIVERAVEWPGIGNLLFTGIYDQNSNVYMGVMVMIGLLTLLARLALDVTTAWLDPRIRSQQYVGRGAL